MLFNELNEELVKKYSENAYSKEYFKIHPRGLEDCYFQIIVSPFGNCQIFSIAWFDYFLRDCNKDTFISNLEYCNELSGKKKILLIDIKDKELLTLKYYIKKSQYTLKDMIMFIKPYTSTNGSKMNLVQLNLKNTILKK